MEKKLTVLLVDACTTTPGKGNRAGVVLDASGLTSEEMQAVAALVNVSETAFMIPAPEAKDHEVHVRYFTPGMEVPTCGHATIASHFARSNALGMDNGQVMAKIGAGILPVDIVTENDSKKVVMTQGAVEFSTEFDGLLKASILKALGLEEDSLMENLPMQEVSTGHSKVMVPVASTKILDRMKPDMDRLTAISREINCNGYFIFTLNSDFDPCLTNARMFAPAVGINEDPVTGNGNGPCGAYLSRHGILPDEKVFSYWGRQGVAMGKEGTMEVTVHRADGSPVKIQVGGTAVEAGSMDVILTEDASGAVSARPASS